MNLWGSQAESFDITGNPVILVKDAKLYEFRGSKSITTMIGSLLKINPDIPETYKLREWYDNEGNQVDVVNVSLRYEIIYFTYNYLIHPYSSFKYFL